MKQSSILRTVATITLAFLLTGGLTWFAHARMQTVAEGAHTLAFLLTGGLTRFAHSRMQTVAEGAQSSAQEQLFQRVLPAYSRLEAPETINGMQIYRAYNGETLVGTAVEASGRGFNKEMRLLVGFDKAGAVVSYEILEHYESEGWGDAVLTWFKGKEKTRSIIGQKPATPLKLVDDGGSIDGITSATYTSRYFLAIINKAYQVSVGNNSEPDAVSGATP
ncbi:MAG: FMN-binding protein [Prevotellaceae bacterium]|jgi:Na+-translocating ferredoxin:NAD+ oxidoreductase RnfG subunit|nr:FMN-binding protein [Prevotellaceae bacterium]